MVSSAFTAPHATKFLTVDVTPTSSCWPGSRPTAPSRASADAPDARRQGRADRPAPQPVAERAVGRSQPGDRAVRLREPGHRRGHAPRTARAEHQGRRPDVPGGALHGAHRTDRDGPGRARPRPADLSGGTISITNIGVFGVDAGTPILNPGEAAILAMGAVRRRPWEYKDGIALRHVMTLSVSFDHRLVDGEQAVPLPRGRRRHPGGPRHRC